MPEKDAKPIVVLSGPIGAGKTTVAQELINISRGRVAYIEGDVFWSFFAKGGPGGPNLQGFRTIMRAMLSSALHYSLGGCETIVDFSVPPWFLDTAKAVANFRDLPLDYVVLYPSLEVCKHRAASRPVGKIKKYDTEFYELFGAAERYLMTETEGTPAEVAARIRKGLNAGNSAFHNLAKS